MEAELHIYSPDSRKRTRQKCPYHKKLEYGEMACYYDTTYAMFDCGTSVDYGAGEYTPPKSYKKAFHLGR